MLDNGQANRTESPLLVQILVWVLAISSHSLYDWAFLHSACSLSFFHALHSRRRRRRLLCVCDVRMFFRLKTFGGKQKKKEPKEKRNERKGRKQKFSIIIHSLLLTSAGRTAAFNGSLTHSLSSAPGPESWCALFGQQGPRLCLPSDSLEKQAAFVLVCVE